MSIPRKKFVPTDDATLDRMSAAYWGEFDRWCERRITMPADKRDKWEIVRNTSPNNDLIDEHYQDVIKLTLRECRDHIDAEAWLNTYRCRSAMRAALGAL